MLDYITITVDEFLEKLGKGDALLSDHGVESQ